MITGKGDKARESAQGLEKSVAAEERKIEAAKGSPLAKGPKRVEERADSAGRKSAETTQKG
jgi:hypothetical protein